MVAAVLQSEPKWWTDSWTDGHQKSLESGQCLKINDKKTHLC